MKYSISEAFESDIDAWDGESEKTFYVGNTSDALKIIGVKDSGIIWHSAKIEKIMRKHPDMTKTVIKQVPQILENPIVVLESKQSDSRLVMFGSVTDAADKPVTAILELQPTSKGGQILDMSVIASAYGKNNAKNLVESSGLVYLDTNIERTKNWMQGLGLQLPSDTTVLGSMGSITYQDGKVKIESVPYHQYMQNSGTNANAQNSLSLEGAEGGGASDGYRVYGEDIRLSPEEIAPTAEEIARMDAERANSQAHGDLEAQLEAERQAVEKIEGELQEAEKSYLELCREISQLIKEGSGENNKGSIEQEWKALDEKIANARNIRDQLREELEQRVERYKKAEASQSTNAKSPGATPEAEFVEASNNSGTENMTNVNTKYSLSNGRNNAKNLVQISGLVYLDTNAKRTKSWMQGVGLQLPADTSAFGSMGSITYQDGKVKIESVPFELIYKKKELP